MYRADLRVPQTTGVGTKLSVIEKGKKEPMRHAKKRKKTSETRALVVYDESVSKQASTLENDMAIAVGYTIALGVKKVDTDEMTTIDVETSQSVPLLRKASEARVNRRRRRYYLIVLLLPNISTLACPPFELDTVVYGAPHDGVVPLVGCTHAGLSQKLRRYWIERASAVVPLHS